MWNVIITLTSVGYGDIWPKSRFGRLIGIIICFWGVFIVSFFVVTVTNMLNLNENEDKAYNLLLRLYYKNLLKREAVLILEKSLVYRNTIRNSSSTESEILNKKMDLRTQGLKFKEKVRDVQNFKVDDEDDKILENILEGLIAHFTKLEETQTNTMTNIDSILGYMELQHLHKDATEESIDTFSSDSDY